MSFKFNYVTNYQLEKFNEIIKTTKILENYILNIREYIEDTNGVLFFNTDFSDSITKNLYKKHIELNYLKILLNYIHENKDLFENLKKKNNIFENKEFFIVLYMLKNILELENEIELDIKFYIATKLQNIFPGNYHVTKCEILEYLEFNNILLLKANLFKHLDRVSVEYLEKFVEHLTELQEINNFHSVSYHLIEDFKEYIFSLIYNFEQTIKIIKSFVNLTGKFFLSDYINNNCNNFVITFPLKPVKENNKRLNSLNLLLDVLYTKLTKNVLKKEYLEDLEYLIENFIVNYTAEKTKNNRKINNNLLNNDTEKFFKSQVESLDRKSKTNKRKIFI